MEIVATADLHGLLPLSLPRRSLTLDAGDLRGGPEGFAVWEGGADPLPGRIRSLGYDAIAPGNHDLDLGPELFSRYVRETGIPVLAANMEGLEPYVLFRRDGMKVAVVGLTTPASARYLYPPLTFSEPLTALRSAMKLLETESPDMVIGLFHIGLDESAELVREVTGLDLVICGHVHVKEPTVRREGKVTLVNPRYGAIIDMTNSRVEPFGLLDPSVRRALLKAFPVSEPYVAEQPETAGPLTVAASFEVFPYDDRVILTADGRSMTLYDYDRLSSRTPIMTVSPYPLRWWMKQ